MNSSLPAPRNGPGDHHTGVMPIPIASSPLNAGRRGGNQTAAVAAGVGVIGEVVGGRQDRQERRRRGTVDVGRHKGASTTGTVPRSRIGR